MSGAGSNSDITRLEYLFQRARRLTREERKDYLERECSDAPQLLEEVDSMLAEDAADTKGFLLSPVQNLVTERDTDQISAPVTTFPNKAPRYIGEYRILMRIGEGGMGRVYLAQHEGTKTKYALKMVRFGAGVANVIERFEKERQVLESMRHENICRIIGGGTYEQIPYFVMEFVEGARSITEYAREEELSLHDRLELFIKICDAVAHGHSRGFLHRDLKPSNILVGSDGVPKLIDYGVARSMATEAPILTEAGQLMGTLQYMSPEQLKFSDRFLDTASDVYSLGIILYELVTGRLPYDVAELPIAEATRIIQEHRPMRASATNPGLKGDLETIVEKALEKQASRRYRTVQALAIDLDRFMKSLPILARPPSLVYQSRLFLRRHPVVTATSAFVGFGLIMGAIFSLLWAQREERARRDAEAMTGFLARSLEDIDPRRNRVLPTVEVLLGRMELKLAAFEDAPILHGRVLSTIGRTYHSLGEIKAAKEHLQKAVDILEDHLGVDHPHSLRARLGLILALESEAGETEGELSEIIPRLEVVLGKVHDDTLEAKGARASLWLEQGRFEEAEKSYLETIAGYEALRGALDFDTLGARGSLASLYEIWDRDAESEAIFNDVIRIETERFGRAAPTTMNGLALLRIKQNRFDEAETILREAIELEVQNLGDSHPWTLLSRFNLGEVFFDTGRYEDAEAMFSEVYDLQVEAIGESAPETVATLNALGRVSMRQNRLEEAEERLHEAVDEIRRRDRRRIELALYLHDHGECLQRMSRLDEAAELLLEAYGVFSAVLGKDAGETRSCADKLYGIYKSTGDVKKAERWRGRS